MGWRKERNGSGPPRGWIDRIARRMGRRGMRGATLLELTVSVSIATVMSLGFFGAMNGITSTHAYEKRSTFYSSEVREVVHQIARDLRAAGANPLAKPFLFDANPVTDVPLVLDPNGDGNLTNDIQVHMDKTGAADNGPDGDAGDSREAVRYRYDAANHRIYRELRLADGWFSQVYLVNVCSFVLSYRDRSLQPTTSPGKVSWIYLDTVTTTSPHNCYEKGQITRRWTMHIKLRNR